VGAKGAEIQQALEGHIERIKAELAAKKRPA
jgi:uncharacterized small protein (DUF1192 family)